MLWVCMMKNVVVCVEQIGNVWLCLVHMEIMCFIESVTIWRNRGGDVGCMEGKCGFVFWLWSWNKEKWGRSTMLLFSELNMEDTSIGVVMVVVRLLLVTWRRMTCYHEVKALFGGDVVEKWGL